MRIENLGKNKDRKYKFHCCRCGNYFVDTKKFVDKCPECGFKFKDPKPRYKKYNTAVIDGKTIPQHRLILESMGIDLTGCSVHHIDGNPKNNDLDNLYICSYRDHEMIHKGKKENPIKGNIDEYIIKKTEEELLKERSN